MKQKKTILICGVVALLICLTAAVDFYFSPFAQKTEVIQASVPAPVVPLKELFPYSIAPRSTLSSSLRELDVDPQIVHQIVEAAKPVMNLGRLHPGTRFQLFYSAGEEPLVTGIKFRFSPVEMLEIKKENDAWTAKKITEPVETRVVTFSGLVSGSLWESAQQAGMDPSLISDLAEIFAWQVDFAREVRENDRWRLSIEQNLVKGEAVGWGAILAAEYNNAGQVHTAVLFRAEGEDKGYFSPDGANLRRMFLKSPIQYGRISSRFSRARFHPIMKEYRAHLGVDYAAPIGTPVRAVGAGTVTFAAFSGGGGNVIKVRHNSTYETAYKHLSRYAKGIRSGAHVEQGQTIGYVGTTGLSTGPHLHFEFFVNGRYVDSLNQKFPSADPVPQNMLAQFQTELSSRLETLPAWGQLEASASDRR